MRIIVTAGPTREHIDLVRFITNASSGKMGYAVATEAGRLGHDVTLLSGPVALPAPGNCRLAGFLTADDLKLLLLARFADCDALVMAAAVGDFRPEKTFPAKLRRSGGPVVLRLGPTEDIVAAAGALKRPNQVIVTFAVEEGRPDEMEANAAAKLAAKNADFTVLNTPAAIAADASRACILSRQGLVLPWADRTKEQLAAEIVSLLDR